MTLNPPTKQKNMSDVVADSLLFLRNSVDRLDRAICNLLLERNFFLRKRRESGRGLSDFSEQISGRDYFSDVSENVKKEVMALLEIDVQKEGEESESAKISSFREKEVEEYLLNC